MTIEKKVAVLPQGQSRDQTPVSEVFSQHDQALIEHKAALSEAKLVSVHSLPLELQRAVQVLSDTYTKLDLRVETTLKSAGNDFIAALPEVEGCELELRHLVAVLIGGLRSSASETKSQSVLLHLAFQDEDDLTQQLLSKLETEGNT